MVLLVVTKCNSMINNSNLAYKTLWSSPEYNNVLATIPEEYKSLWSAQEYKEILFRILDAYEALWSVNEFNNHIDSLIELPFTEQMLESLLTKYTKVINTAFITDVILFDNTTVKEQAITSMKRSFVKANDGEIAEKKQQLESQLSKFNELLFTES